VALHLSCIALLALFLNGCKEPRLNEVPAQGSSSRTSVIADQAETTLSRPKNKPAPQAIPSPSPTPLASDPEDEIETPIPTPTLAPSPSPSPSPVQKVTALQPTYYGGIKTLLDKHCVKCHKAGGEFPDLSSYDNAKLHDNLVELRTRDQII